MRILFRTLHQTRLNRIARNICQMDSVILIIPNPMIRKPCNPNLTLPAKFSFGSKRESALQTLHRQFETHYWSDQNMEVIGHYDKAMQQIPLRPIVVQRLEKQLCPPLRPKKWSAFRG